MTMYNEVMKYKEDSFEVRLRHLKFSRLLEVTQSLILLYYATFFKPIVKSSSVFGFEIKIWFISLIREKMWYKVKLVTLLRIQFCIVCNNSNFFGAQKSLNGSKGPILFQYFCLQREYKHNRVCLQYNPTIAVHFLVNNKGVPDVSSLIQFVTLKLCFLKSSILTKCSNFSFKNPIFKTN